MSSIEGRAGLRSQNGVVHALEIVNERHVWTVCRRYGWVTTERNPYESRMTQEPTTCVFCLTGTRWKNKRWR